jgi:Domain of unknown function (DU1801)
MALEAKTKPGAQGVEAFVKSLEPERRRNEARTMLALMKRLSGEEPVMWGPSMIGFGSYDYTYESGHSGTYFRTGFSPRKAALSVYLIPGFEKKAALLDKLGPHETGKSCLYIKDLMKVNAIILEELIATSLKEMNQRYPKKA